MNDTFPVDATEEQVLKLLRSMPVSLESQIDLDIMLYGCSFYKTDEQGKVVEVVCPKDVNIDWDKIQETLHDTQ